MNEEQIAKEIRQLRYAMHGDGVYVGISGRLDYLEKAWKRAEAWDSEIFRLKIMAFVAVFVSLVSLATAVIQVWG